MDETIEKKTEPTAQEDRLAEEKIAAGERNAVQLPQTKSLDDYVDVDAFIKRYREEPTFQKIVHTYMKLNALTKASLYVGKKFIPTWYKKRTDQLITQYALKIREDMQKAAELEQEMSELKKAEQQAQEHYKKVKAASAEKEQIEEQYTSAVVGENTKKQQILQKYEAKKAEEAQLAEEKKKEIEQKTDAAQLAKQKLKECIAKSPLIAADKLGNLSFDEKQLAAVLEEKFLNEIVAGIEKKEGITGFLTRVKSEFDEMFTYHDVIEHLGELPNVDWVQSTIYSRTRGYRLPTYPYLMVGRGEGQKEVRTSVNTAAALDFSGSTAANDRYIIIKKIGIALPSLMRKMNPQNKTDVAGYNDNLFSLTTSALNKLYQLERPEGATRTDLALEWLLETLGDEPGIAYLITDGYPEIKGMKDEKALDMCINIAKKFRERPYLLLRIFLIDGKYETEGIIRQIGKAAGSNTAVIPVKNYALAEGVIKDVRKAIGKMYDITQF